MKPVHMIAVLALTCVGCGGIAGNEFADPSTSLQTRAILMQQGPNHKATETVVGGAYVDVARLKNVIDVRMYLPREPKANSDNPAMSDTVEVISPGSTNVPPTADATPVWSVSASDLVADKDSAGQYTFYLTSRNLATGSLRTEQEMRTASSRLLNGDLQIRVTYRKDLSEPLVYIGQIGQARLRWTEDGTTLPGTSRIPVGFVNLSLLQSNLGLQFNFGPLPNGQVLYTAYLYANGASPTSRVPLSVLHPADPASTVGYTVSGKFTNSSLSLKPETNPDFARFVGMLALNGGFIRLFYYTGDVPTELNYYDVQLIRGVITLGGP